MDQILGVLWVFVSIALAAIILDNTSCPNHKVEDSIFVIMYGIIATCAVVAGHIFYDLF